MCKTCLCINGCGIIIKKIKILKISGIENFFKKLTVTTSKNCAIGSLNYVGKGKWVSGSAKH